MNRTNAPTPDIKAEFKIPQLITSTISSGVELNFISKQKLPIVFTEIIVFAGSRLDPANKKGLSYLTSLLIDEGAAEYNSLQLSNEFEKLGTIFSVTSDNDTTILSILSLKENFERSLELLSKIILQPRFDEKDFEREKNKVLSRILQLKDEPSFIASTAFEKRIFENTFYGFSEIGYDESVNKINNDEIKYFYGQTFSASNAKIIAVGDLSESESSSIFNKYFGVWNSASKIEVDFSIPKRSRTKFYFVHKADSAQSEIRVGHVSKKRDAEDYMPTKIMNTILGGQFSSRINLNLRERKGFTYGAHSSFHYYKEAGLFEVSTAVDIENSGAAVKEILNELNGIRENITTEEIDFAKSYLVKQFPSRFETYNQVAKNYESLLIYSLQEDELNHYTKRIEAATADQIKEAALNNVHPNDLVIVLVGDREKVFNQLKSIADDDPIELDIYGNFLN
jgi:zinc protease